MLNTIQNILESEFISQLLKFFGLIYISYKLLPIISTVFNCFVAPGKNIKEFAAGTGAWAVVTGCTDGIGKELSLLLAKEKFNLILISRNQTKLDDIEKQIIDEYAVQTKTLALDFAAPGIEKFNKVKEIINDLPIHVLVNNVGKSHEHPKYFEEETDQEMLDILNININGTLFMTKTVLPQMKKSTASGPYSGLVLFVGSFAGLVPTPLLSTYSSSKAFLQTFAMALGPELEKEKILVSNVLPYFVKSNMSKVKKESYVIPSAKTFAQSVMNKIGVAGGSNLPNNSSPYFPHAMLDMVFSNFANIAFWIALNKDQMINTRKKALKKKEREAQAKLTTSKQE